MKTDKTQYRSNDKSAFNSTLDQILSLLQTQQEILQETSNISKEILDSNKEIIQSENDLKEETLKIMKVNFLSLLNQTQENIRQITISDINKYRSENDIERSKINEKIFELNTEILRAENTFKEEISNIMKVGLNELSNELSKNLISNLSIGMTYSESIFGSRLSHFFYEKKAIAKKMIDILHQELTANKQKKICLLIDSGTTTYHLFSEICDKIKKPSDTDDEINPWKDRVFIITNNLPGIQHFINHCRKGSGEYSDLSIKCFLLPGKPLPVYAAVTGPEAIAFMNKARVKQLIKRELKTENDTEYQIISLMSANYIVRHPKEIDSKIIFCPTARGGGKGGHFEIKEEFAKLSDKIYLISPLTKLSFATCECLNKINELTIDEEKIPEDLNEYHDKVKYREIKLTTPELIEKCNFVLTDRKNTDTFGDFAHDILLTLKNSYGENKIHIADYDLGAWIPNGTKNPEYYKIAMEMEIPHENLRNAYYRNKKINDHFIWAHNWMIIDEKCRQGDHM